MVEVRDIGFNLDGSAIWLSGGNKWRHMQTVPVSFPGELRSYQGGEVVNIDWSPDGLRAVYHKSDDGDPLLVADRNLENAVEILVGKTADHHQHYPTWSFEGDWVFLVRGTPATGEMDLWRVRPDGDASEQLTRELKDVAYPTPIDARTVLFIAREPNGAGPWLWALDLDSKEPRRISVGIQQYTSLGASKDGRRLVATVADPKTHLWSVPIGDDIARETDTSPLAELRGTPAMAPRFAGESLLYLASRGAGGGLWRVKGGAATEIRGGSDYSFLDPPGVSPDGERLSVVLRRRGRREVHILDVDGGDMRLLCDVIDARGASSCSPDGRWIATGGSDTRGSGLFTIPVQRGEPKQIVTGPALNPVWSPTDDLIVYAGPRVRATHRVRAVRRDGTPVEIPEIEVTRAGERFRFSPGGRLVYMQGTGPVQDFWEIDLQTGQKRQLTQLSNVETMTSFDIDPNGKRVVFDRELPNSDVVLMELPRE